MSDFDITQHEWSDRDVGVDDFSNEYIDLCVNYFDNYNDCVNEAGLRVTRKDAVAIAKHFGLTKEDLE